MKLLQKVYNEYDNECLVCQDFVGKLILRPLIDNKEIKYKLEINKEQILENIIINPAVKKLFALFCLSCYEDFKNSGYDLEELNRRAEKYN